MLRSLTNGATYTVTVSCTFNDGTTSHDSAPPVTVTPQDPLPPLAVTAVGGEKRATLTREHIEGEGSSVTHFDIEMNPSQAAAQQPQLVVGDPDSRSAVIEDIIVSGLSSSFRFRVIAVSSAGRAESPWTEQIFVTDATVPDDLVVSGTNPHVLDGSSNNGQHAYNSVRVESGARLALINTANILEETKWHSGAIVLRVTTSVVVESGGELRFRGATIFCDTFLVKSNGHVSGFAQGYPPGDETSQFWPVQGSQGTYVPEHRAGGGGAHGGIASPPAYPGQGSGLVTYGSLKYPILFGTAGGRGPSAQQIGTPGGGAIRIVASISVTVEPNATIETNGGAEYMKDTPAYHATERGESGRGAGGSVLIQTPLLVVEGDIAANGGEGVPAYRSSMGGSGFPGGGGRVALHCGQIQGWNNISTRGGFLQGNIEGEYW